MENNKQSEQKDEINVISEKTAQEKTLDILESNFKLNQEILKSVKFLKNYFYWKTIFNFIKIGLLVAIVVLGFISIKPIISYLQTSLNDLEVYSDRLDSVSSQINSVKGIVNKK